MKRRTRQAFSARPNRGRRLAEVIRRGPVAGVCRAPEPAHRRRVIRRRHALPLVETVPEVVHRFRQTGLGAPSVPLHGLLVFLPRI